MRPLTLFIILFFSLAFVSASSSQPDTSLFKPSTSKSFSGSKKKLMKMYLGAGMDKTLYCGCSFDSKKNIDHSACGYTPRKSTNKRSRRLEWEHIMPAFKFGSKLQCWSEKLCTKRNGKKYKGRSCCGKVSPDFKKMESDMHNLFPAIGEVNGDRSNYPFGEIKGEPRKYGQCDLEIKRKVAEPTESVRGDIARAYFYMSRQYGVPLLERFEDMLRMWHVSDPPDQWEMDRNNLIEEIQGNRNPFIDHPELVERVRDF